MYKRQELEIHHHHIAPESYLSLYVQELSTHGQMLEVDFSTDPELSMKKQKVPLPLSKLVWGLQRFPCKNDKCLFVTEACVQAAYQDLVDWMMEPRGIMFWNIDEEGADGQYYAQQMNNVLHIRSSTT